MSEKRSENPNPLVSIIMGSKSDWEVMQHAAQTLGQFAVANECRVLSAHRTPRETTEYVSSAQGRGVEVIIAAAGGAASGGGGGGAYGAACIGCADAQRCATGSGFAAFDGADAGGDSRGDAGDREAGGDQCGAVGDRDSVGVAAVLRQKLLDYRKEQSQGILKETLP